MPLFTRTIQPVAVSRIEVDPSIQNELECVTNNTLSNIIRQLSGLSKYAEDMFMELTQEATNVFTRSSHLQHRIDNLRDKVTQLNATVEEVSLQDIHLRKPFKSSISKEQQVISRNTVPRSILESYTKCTQPPALDKLNEFREDGKDSMKFYTDPGYFFELWVAEMEKDFQHKKAELHKKRQKRRPRDQTQQRVVRKVVTRKEEWESKKYGQELSDYHVPDVRKHIVNQTVPSNMVQINNNNTAPHQSQRPDSINIQKQNSVVRKDSQKHNHQHADKHENASTKPVQNGPVQIPYNQPEHNHVANQIPQSNHMAHDVRGTVTSPQYRPSERPPGPPVANKDSPSSGRDILPPPPPPPPAEQFAQHQSSPYQVQLDNGMKSTGSPRHLVHQNSAKNSPARHQMFSPHISMNQSMDLPPPPLSPKDNTPDTPVSMEMPPPPSPPPPLDQYNPTNFVKAPSPPPPPPPPPPPMDMKMQNGHLRSQPDEASISSSGSTVTTISNPVGKAESDRSALLEEIRIGTHLKKLNRLEEKEEKKKMPAGRLDVQAIMDKAFEMRRRVIEDSESEEEADSDDNDW
ncbi:actin-binding protein WASF3 [Patella vulgata]|uniref:actin-binding protein WASF3 n=1 Tax=Patella vulgata TaxID=6465 RepID=UPI00218072A9|nr:actin-binding protein WASF3 [Patella vulgata]